ncbi:MAG: polyprenyl synthetase family protein, partial [Phycisphaerae bacterium]
MSENRMDAIRPKGSAPSASPPEELKAFAGEFDERFRVYLSSPGDVPLELADAVRYSALGPGKRIRPYLVVRCCEVVGGRREDAWPVAASVECIHAFSLIHDDLPAMDDDDVRRGRPTSHKKFGEALAILAGDALVTLAFEILADRVNDGELASALVGALAHGGGWAGMIGGQAADVVSESRAPSVALARYIHERKTASLFEAACRMGALIGGGHADQSACLCRYGHNLGRAFQIADDLLDEVSTTPTSGKSPGEEPRGGKQTFPRCVGTTESEAAALEAARAAGAELDMFGSAADDLRRLAE